MDKNLSASPTRPSTPPVIVRSAAKSAALDGHLMFFLLRMAFWLGVVLILLPSGTAQHGQAASEVGASDAISAASATVSDLRGFCTRQPDACTVGSQVAVSLGYKAQAGAKMLYEFLTERAANRQAGSTAAAGAQRGGAGKSGSEKAVVEKASEDTLTPADLTPTWRGTPARRDSKPSA
jgi:hypothetical protein